MPPTATDPRHTVAAFDVDGTLTTRDCVTPYLWRVAGVRLATTLARHPFALIAALVRRDQDRLKELASRAVRGRDAAWADREGERFARMVGARWMRADTTARLTRHRELGHRIVLVSASFEAYLRPLGASLAVDGVIGTRLEVGADGRMTGALEGANCRGPEKARRLAVWLEDNELAGAAIWAYGDSAGDADLLAMAEHAVWVRDTQIAPDPTPTG